MANDDHGGNMSNAQKLKGKENFKSWRPLMESILTGKDLWEYIDPEEGDRRELPVKVDGQDQAAFDQQRKRWQVSNGKASATIMMNCQTHIIETLAQIKGAAAQWDYLQEQYEPTGAAYRMSVFNQWEELRHDGKGLEEFCTKYQSVLRQMDGLDIVISKELRVYGFLSRVAPYFSTWAEIKREHFRYLKGKGTQLDTQLPSVDDLVKGLLDEEREQKRSASTAAYVKGKAQSNDKSDKKEKRKWQPCTSKKCNSRTHKSEDCWRLHPEKTPEHLKRESKDDKKSAVTSADSDAVTSHKGFFHRVSHTVYEVAQKASNKNDWIFDTGASAHCANNLKDFVSHHPVEEYVQVGDSEFLRAYASGTIERVLVASNGSLHRVEINEVLYVPDMASNLISGEKLRKKGLFYRNDTQSLFTADQELGTVKTVGDLPHLVQQYNHTFLAAMHDDVEPRKALNSSIISASKAPMQLWHLRTGHATENTIKRAAERSVGIVIEGGGKLDQCSGCERGGAKRQHSRVPAARPETIYTEVSVDTVVTSTDGIGGVRYFTLMTDSTSLYRHEYEHSVRSHAGRKLQEYIIYVEVQTNRKIKVLRLDNTLDYGGKEFDDFCRERGIRLHRTTPRNSEQNGRAEVSNHIVCRVARKLMISGKVSKYLWPEAVRTATMLLNLLPSRTLDSVAPYEIVAMQQQAAGDKSFPLKPNLSNLRAYGCIAYVYNDGVARGDKFESRAQIGKLVGYENGSYNIYRIWLPEAHRVVRTVSVRFDESKFDLPMEAYDEADIQLFEYGDATSGGETDEAPSLGDERIENELPEVGRPHIGSQSDSQVDSSEETAYEFSPPPAAPDNPTAQATAPTRTSGRATKSSDKAKDNQRMVAEGLIHPDGRTKRAKLAIGTPLSCTAYKAFTASLQNGDQSLALPRSYEEALKSSQSEEWLNAMRSEVDSLTKHGCWKLVKLPDGASVVKGRWVFAIKRDAEGALVRYKARWVARGFTQQRGVDYDDTYASVTKPSTVKVLLSLVAHYGLQCKQYDIMTAFLHALMGKWTVYVEQPHGFQEGDSVCLLLRALYGLKQSPLLWYQELTKYLRSIQFTTLWSDACLFRHEPTGALVVIYVDDLLIIATSTEVVESVSQALASQFEVKELGDVAFYLGCRIIRDWQNRTIYMVQDGYIKRLAERFKLEGSIPVATPLPPNCKLQKADEGYEANKGTVHYYGQLVGSLMWPSIITRIDTCYAACQLAKYLTNPSAQHISAAEHCIRYLLSHANEGICLGGTATLPRLEAYTDASWADDLDTRRSTCGYVFFYGGPIAWKSGRQPLIAQSTTEAEYIAMTLTAKESSALKRLLDEVGEAQTGAVIVHEDSKPAIDLLARPTSEGRTRHIDTRYHYIREQVEGGAIKVHKVHTDQQAADGLTKALDKLKHQRFKDQVGIIDCTELLDQTQRK